MLELVLGWRVFEFEHIRREDQRCGCLLGQGDPDRAVDEIGYLLGHGAHLDVLTADILEQREHVDLLLVRPTHGAAFGLPDQCQYRHVVELGVVEPVEQVDTAGAACGGAHADLSGELRVTDRLKRRHLFVAGLNELGRVVGATPGGQQPVDAVARITEDLSDVPLP